MNKQEAHDLLEKKRHTLSKIGAQISASFRGEDIDITELLMTQFDSVQDEMCVLGRIIAEGDSELTTLLDDWVVAVTKEREEKCKLLRKLNELPTISV